MHDLETHTSDRRRAPEAEVDQALDRIGAVVGGTPAEQTEPGTTRASATD
jgi:hypothetical protein